MNSQARPIPSPTAPWAPVAVLIFAAGVLGSAALAWSFTLFVIGVVLILAALAGTAVLTKAGPHR